MKGPRTYVGAALDEIARKRLRRARRAARTVDRDFHELVDREMNEIVYIEGHRTEAPYPDGDARVEYGPDDDFTDVRDGDSLRPGEHQTELPYPDGPLASRKVDGKSCPCGLPMINRDWCSGGHFVP